MPQLSSKSPELQALAVLLRTVAPLLVKRIDCDCANMNILSVINSWELLQTELKQIPLYLEEREEVSEHEYEKFQDALHDVLGQVEGLIDREVLQHTADQEHELELPTPDPRLGYPRLEALMIRSSNPDNPQDFSRMIHLPKATCNAKALEESFTRLNDDNSRRRNRAGHRISKSTKPTSSRHESTKSAQTRFKLEKAKEWQKHTSLLLQLFTTRLHQNCLPFHTAMLQIREPVEESNVHFKIYVSSCQSSNSTRRTLRWQETSCEFVYQRTLENEKDYKEVKNLCRLIQRRLKDEKNLHVLIDSHQLLWHANTYKFIDSPSVQPTLSLEEVLTSHGNHFKPYDKVIMALNLARGLLRMCATDKELRNWSIKGIFFLFDDEKHQVLEAYNPFITCSLDHSHLESGATGLQHHRSKFGILINLAKLLMEIARGGPLILSKRPVHIQLLAEIGSPGRTGEVTKEVPELYIEAMEECLLTDRFDDSDSGSDTDGEDTMEVPRSPESEENRCREVIISVITKLEKALQFYGRKTDPDSPFQFTFTRPHSNEAIETTNHTSISIPTTQATSTMQLDRPPLPSFTTACITKLQLADSHKFKGTSDYSRVRRSEYFLQQTFAFYEQHLESSISGKRIRVAILDTGIDQSNPFWRSASSLRKGKDCPIKEIKSFVKGSTKDGREHGTNVAAIVSKVAPEADLYIAQIADADNMEESTQVIAAIKWAVSHKVHIINMSFSTVGSKNSEIEASIEDAKKKGIIFVVAAGNPGGHNTRAFPAKSDYVLCIHATDGFGNDGGMNPSPSRRFSDHFTTLGVAIQSVCEPGICIEGTSYAAPVASGMAANILTFVQQVIDAGWMDLKYWQEASSKRGMRNIFRGMSDEPRNGYQFIKLGPNLWTNCSDMGMTISKLKEVLDEDM